MTRKEVITQFCKISSNVAENRFKHSESADCFCGKHIHGGFSFSGKVIQFVQDAVEEKLARTKA